MPDSNTDFTYVSVLRELEKEVAACAGKEAPRAGADLTRTNAWFKGTVGGLLSFATDRIANGNRSIARKLDVKEAAIKKAEQARLRQLTAWTQRQTRYEIGQPTAWPPLVPIGLAVERFVGTAIGLHSEYPEEKLIRHIQSSLADAIAPALAWGLWCQHCMLSQEIRPRAAEAIKASIMNSRKESGDVAKLTLTGDAETSAEIPYLRLVHGWINVLQQQNAVWRQDPDALGSFRAEIVDQFERYRRDPNAGLSELLLQHYGATDQGSERARVMAMVQRRSPNSAAFLRSRLSLLSGAHHPALERFRHLLLAKPGEALEDAEALLEDDHAEHKDFGELACGRAYWLARMTYGRHEDRGLLAAKASDLTLQLLRKAADHFRDEPEKRTYCLRFAAGYATNPRYFRSEYVLSNQGEVVSAYEREPLHRPRVADMFKARIAWQCQASSKGLKNSPFAEKSARLYNQALSGALGSASGLDSEAPVHLFPELYVFLEEFSDKKARNKSVLAVIDHVVQHNYGIYFDAVIEEKLLKAGIKQFREWCEEHCDEMSLREDLRVLTDAKANREYIVHEVVERKIRAKNARKPRDEETG